MTIRACIVANGLIMRLATQPVQYLNFDKHPSTKDPSSFKDASKRKPVLEAFRDREDQCSTGIGAGIAIPHAFLDDIDNVIAVFGRSPEGIDFCALDNAPVHYVVLFVVPRSQYTLHLKTLAAIAKKLNSGDVRNLLATATNGEEIIKILADPSPARA